MDVRTQHYTSSRYGSYGYVGITKPLVFQRKIFPLLFPLFKIMFKARGGN